MKTSLTEDITPLTEFRNNTAKLLQKIKKTHRPLILTQKGRSSAVVENVKDYETRLERLDLLEAIVRSLQASEKGDIISHDEVLRRLDDLISA